MKKNWSKLREVKKKEIYLKKKKKKKNIIQNTFDKAITFPFNTPTSLQLDINSKKENNELELFAGAIINYGKEVNIATLFTEKIYSELKSI